MTQRWSLAVGHVPDATIVALLFVCFAVTLVEAGRAYVKRGSRVSRRTAAAILGLRLVSVLGVGAMAFELTLRFDDVAPQIRRVVVLADRSASMAIPDAAVVDGPRRTRQDRMEALWAASAPIRAGWLAQDLQLDVRGFDADVVAYAGEQAETLATAPVGRASDLTAALRSLAQDRAQVGDPPAAIVVLSDGVVNERDGALGGEQQLAEATRLQVPITTVALGAPVLVDAAVQQVRAGEFAFVENVTEFEATVVAHGLEGRRARVELWREGERVATHPVRFGVDGAAQVVTFEVAPARVGQFIYEVVVPELPGEATSANNRRSFVLKVLRDKIRVLHVAGRPDWDVRALRTLLRRDPNVELLSYYILRDVDDVAREDSDALSLIPFPTEELFDEELGSFDVVILHNFDAVPHQVADYVENIAKFVQDGGNLVFIGGDLGLSDGGYATPAMSAVLPIELRRPSVLRQEAFRPTLTEAGARHPITQWLNTNAGAGWSSLPELDNWNPVTLSTRGEQGALTLLAHPDELDAHGEPRPIVAVAEPGKGRVVVVATGASWRLGFAPELALVDGARPYDLLWLGVMQWLLRDEGSGRIQLETDKPRYRDGETVRLRVQTRTAAYAVEPAVRLTWQVQPIKGGSGPVAIVREGVWQTDGSGRAEVEVPGLPVGAYRAVAMAVGAKAAEGGSPGAQRVFVVEAPGRELARIAAGPGTQRLRELAEATGGAFVEAIADDSLPAVLPLSALPAHLAQGRVVARRENPLWGSPVALLLLLVGFGGEWWLRRWRGVA